MSNRRRDTLPKNRNSSTTGPASQRRVSRREKEQRQRKQLYTGLIIAAVLSIAIVTGFALNEYWIKPRAVLASVNGVEIRRKDYWKVRSIDLVNQFNQYQQFAQMVDASQQQQYLTLAQQAAEELDGVWGSTDIDDATLTKMVEDQVYLQGMGSLGLSVTDEDVDQYILQQFQPANAPIVTQTPTPTFIPQRADWATQTEVALAAQGEETPTVTAGSPVGSPEAIASPVGSPESIASPAASPETAASPAASPEVVGSPVASPETAGSPVASPETAGSPAASPESAGSPVASAEVAGSPVASPEVAGSPMASPETAGSPIASPDVAGSPVASPETAGSPVASPETVGSPVASPGAASPVASPEVASPVATATETVEATPNPTQAVETASASYETYQDNVFGVTHMSDADYRRLVVEPAVARQQVSDYLLKDVGQTAAQVHAQHILVDTKDLADSIYQQLQAGADFSETAMQQSNDTGTAENGGDLGWFTHGQMVDQFDAVAFSLQPGQISEPFQTQFGWHIVKVLETDPNRALTDQQMTQYRDSIVQDWVDAQMASMTIKSKVEPTPTPALSSFVPPPDAPPLPTAVPSVEASPVAEASPVGSPVASPIGSPVASPIAGSPTAESSPASSPAP